MRCAALQSDAELVKVRTRLETGEEAIGVRMGDLFATAKAHTDLSLDEVNRLLDHPAYEPRMAALCIMDFKARRRLDDRGCRELFDVYVGRHDRITTWDRSTVPAPRAVGGHLSVADLLHQRLAPGLDLLAGEAELTERRHVGGILFATSSASPRANARNSSFLATKSVSQFTSTSAPSLRSGARYAPIAPSAAMRQAALLALAPLLMRSRSSAFFMSPPASSSAFLHSIMPSPVSLAQFLHYRCGDFRHLSSSDATSELKKGGIPAPSLSVFAMGASPAARFLDLDEFVRGGGDDLLDDLAAAFENRVGDAARVQPNRAARVVVAGDHVRYALG